MDWDFLATTVKTNYKMISNAATPILLLHEHDIHDLSYSTYSCLFDVLYLVITFKSLDPLTHTYILGSFYTLIRTIYLGKYLLYTHSIFLIVQLHVMYVYILPC